MKIAVRTATCPAPPPWQVFVFVPSHSTKQCAYADRGMLEISRIFRIRVQQSPDLAVMQTQMRPCIKYAQSCRLVWTGRQNQAIKTDFASERFRLIGWWSWQHGRNETDTTELRGLAAV